jgi:galactofuranose transport system ATP-binding protein
MSGGARATRHNGVMDEPPPLLELTGTTVRFGAETALDAVDFRMFPGEVHSLMGENGAGKSTLIKALTGAQRLDAGEVRLAGEVVHFATPADALRAGISTVYQEIDLLPNLTVAENICLGREPRRFGMLDWKAMRQRAREVLAGLGLEIDPASLLGTHSLAVQQLVAIARAISTDVRVLVLDEPTSSLDVDEVAELFRVMRDLTQRGVAVLFVSHFLEQVYEICDRITVLRNGRLVGEYVPSELLRIDLVQKMLGRSAAELGTRARVEPAAPESVPLLQGDGVTRAPGIHGAGVELAEGEVLGLAGLLGSGRTELARALTGIDRPDAGIITISGQPVDLTSPRKAISLGVVYSSENRRTEGIISELSVQENITLALQAERGILRRMRPQRRRELAMSWIEALDIRPADPDRSAGTLSGGNQQKVLLARLLALSPRVIVLDEPTRGIDVGAKVEIQNLVGELADNGLSVVFISAELEEVLRVASRVAVLRAGRIVETLPSESLTVESLMALVAQPDEFSEAVVAAAAVPASSFPAQPAPSAEGASPAPPTGGGPE